VVARSDPAADRARLTQRPCPRPAPAATRRPDQDRSGRASSRPLGQVPRARTGLPAGPPAC